MQLFNSHLFSVWDSPDKMLACRKSCDWVFIQVFVCVSMGSDAVLGSHGYPLPRGWLLQHREGQLWMVQALRIQVVSSARHWARQGQFSILICRLHHVDQHPCNSGFVQVRVGLVQFSSSPQLEFSLDSYSTKQELKKHIKKVSYRCVCSFILLTTNRCFWKNRGQISHTKPYCIRDLQHFIMVLLRLWKIVFLTPLSGEAAPRQAWLWNLSWGRVFLGVVTPPVSPASPSCCQMGGLRATWSKQPHSSKRAAWSCLLSGCGTQSKIYGCQVLVVTSNKCIYTGKKILKLFGLQVGGTSLSCQWTDWKPCLLCWALPGCRQWSVHDTEHFPGLQCNTCRLVSLMSSM